MDETENLDVKEIDVDNNADGGEEKEGEKKDDDDERDRDGETKHKREMVEILRHGFLSCAKAGGTVEVSWWREIVRYSKRSTDHGKLKKIW